VGQSMNPRHLTDFVAKLNRLTQEGRLRWTLARAPSSLTQGSDSSIPAFFQCELRGKTVGIYEERFQDWSVEAEVFFWRTRLVLALFDYAGNQVWEFPDGLSGLGDLWNAVRYRSADVDEYLDAVLADDSEQDP
jgi:hypothetical protein